MQCTNTVYVLLRKQYSDTSMIARVSLYVPEVSKYICHTQGASDFLFMPAQLLCTLSSRLSNGLNGIKIENQGKQSMLIFFNVSEEDYGNYTCVAMNTMGITNASIILYGEDVHDVDMCKTCKPHGPKQRYQLFL